MQHPRRSRRAVTGIAGAAALTLIWSLGLTAPATAAIPDPPYRFDFQPAGAPLGAGFVEVTRATAYTPERGYGIVTDSVSNMLDRNRGGTDPVGGDFIAYFNGSYQFLADIPNGEYDVEVIVGELGGSATTNVAIEGVALGTINASGAITRREFPGVVVADGQFTLGISGRTGHLSGLVITSVIEGPTGLRATDISVEGATGTVDLAWAAIDQATSYRIFRDAGTGPVQIGETDQPTFSDDAVAFAQTYTYTVAGVTANGIQTRDSAPLTVSVFDQDVPPPVTPGTPTVASYAGDTATITWSAVEGADSYRVERALRPTGPWSVATETTGTTWTDLDAPAIRSVSYRIVAVNRGGFSAPSGVVSSEIRTHLVRQAEYLDRAPLAVTTDGGVYVGWRMLGLDPDTIGFRVYRDAERLTDETLTGSTNLLDADGAATSTYRVSQVLDGVETWATDEFSPWTTNHLDIPLDKPADGVTPTGQAYSYHANDLAVADLNGDGVLDYVVKWEPSNARDNSQNGYTGNVFLDGYTLSGERLWRIDLGRNIRAGAHYTQMMVYDLDGDGKAELVVKTADATVDAAGPVIGNPDADHRNSSGYVLTGPEFLTVFNGETGVAVDTIDYIPARGNVGSWGDTYGNRVDRFLAGIAYLDGETPSVVFSRPLSVPARAPGSLGSRPLRCVVLTRPVRT